MCIMEIIDAYGGRMFVLPDDARCRCTGENPMYMSDCPYTEYFDGSCCPELCDFYTEGD